MIEDDRIRLQEGPNDCTAAEAIPEDLPLPIDQWTAAIQEGTQPSIGRPDVICLTLVNEYAGESNVQGTWVEVSYDMI